MAITAQYLQIVYNNNNINNNNNNNHNNNTLIKTVVFNPVPGDRLCMLVFIPGLHIMHIK